MMYRIQTYLTGLMPESSAAVRLPPIAAAYLPRIVLRWTTARTPTTSEGDEEGERQTEDEPLASVQC